MLPIFDIFEEALSVLSLFLSIIPLTMFHGFESLLPSQSFFFFNMSHALYLLLSDVQLSTQFQMWFSNQTRQGQTYCRNLDFLLKGEHGRGGRSHKSLPVSLSVSSVSLNLTGPATVILGVTSSLDLRSMYFRQEATIAIPLSENQWPLEGSVVTGKDFGSLISQGFLGPKRSSATLRKFCIPSVSFTSSLTALGNS